MFRSAFRPLFLLASLATFFACHLTQSGKAEPVFDFPTLKATIGDADHAVIVLKDSTGKVIDTLYNAAVTPATTFRGLDAPHYDGGKATIHIEATKGGVIVYQVERGYDGKNGGNQSSIVLVSPGTKVDIEWLIPRIRAGDSVVLPSVKIEPLNLANKDLTWISRHPHLLGVTATHLKGITPGIATLVIALKSDTAKKDSLAVEVLPATGKAIDSLRLSPDPLPLALRGPTGRFTLTVHPTTAPQEVAWKSLDPATVSVAADGLLGPLAEGTARIVATSTADSTVLDTARVQVRAPVPVDSIRLDRDSLEIFANGTAEELVAVVSPSLANPAFLVLSRDPSVVGVEGGKVRGLKEGETWVQVRSVEDESKTDSLRVLVFPYQKVDSVRVKPDTLRLYVKGEGLPLTASIHPATLQGRFTWRSGEPRVAGVDPSGKVSPVAEGKTYVSVRARADSTKKDSSLIIVKKDTPRLFVGADTVISAGTTLTFRPEVSQEYGLVVLFKWDLTGDGVYEDSSTAIKSPLTQHYAEVKDYAARFYVRDTEGNDTVVVRKVKAVNGRVVQITSPKDGAYVNTTPFTITWSVDGSSQSNSQALNPGANTVTRSAVDSAGKAYSHSITVHLDQTAPNRPTVKGPSGPVNTLTPEWRWTSGGGGGNGIYRSRIGNSDLSTQVASPDTFYTASSNLTGGTHTLYVSERDEAGNWSPNGSFAIRIDTTVPAAPTVSVAPASPSRNARPTWSWTGGTGDAHRFYRYKLYNDDFRSGAKDTTGTSFTPAANLPDTVHTLYVQERDSAGNWSASASRSITIDTQGPTAPTVSVAPAALTNDDTPTWSWPAVSGATGYRFKVNDANLDGAPEITALTHTPASGLGEGTFTLYVQARDAAGNWSPSGSRTVRIDLTPSTAPRMDSTPYSPLNSLRPMWTWRSGTGGAKVFRARVDGVDWTGVAERTDSSFTPEAHLGEGRHTVYVQERDSAGNWSATAEKSNVLTLRREVGAFSAEGGFDWATLVSNKDGIAMVAYSGQSASAGVKRFNGLGWDQLGDPSNFGTFRYQNSAAISQSGVPYLALLDSLDRPSIVRYVGNQWQPIGPQRFTPGGAGEVAIALSKSDVPYVAFRDAANAGLASVMRWSGTSWENVGPRGISAGFSIFFSIAISSSGAPIVAFLDNGLANENGSAKVTIKRYNATSATWSNIGDLAVHSKSNNPVSLVNTEEDSLFIALKVEESAGAGEVYKFNGSTWIPVGDPVYQPPSDRFPLLAIAPQGNKYVAYTESSVGQRQGILKVLRVRSWITMPASARFDEVCGLALTSEGVPWILYQNQGTLSVWKMSFDP